MPTVAFEPAISASELPQTYAIDRAATKIVLWLKVHYKTNRTTNSAIYINMTIINDH